MFIALQWDASQCKLLSFSLSSFDQFHQVHETLDNGCNYTKLFATKFRIKKDENKINTSIAQISSQQNCNIYIFKKKKIPNSSLAIITEVYFSIRYEYIELLCTNNSAIRTIKC